LINSNNNIVMVSGTVVFTLYLFHCYMVFYILPGVSVPSGPRPHKIQRIPQWNDQYWDIHTASNSSQSIIPPVTSSSSSSIPLHRYVHGLESHNITEQIHNQVKLTGEPAGRDMWTVTTATMNNINNTSDTVTTTTSTTIQVLASGGRQYNGFNPNINPNRYVSVIYVCV
jgi:hypothetical protein